MTEEIDASQSLQEDLDVETYIDDMKGNEPIEFCQTKRAASVPGARYICPYGCGKLVAMRTIDYHKNNGCTRRLTDIISGNPELKKRYYCCGACYSEFVTRLEFHAHLRVEHDVHPEIHNVNFKDRPTFDRFVRWLEMEGGAHFRHKSGTKRRGRGKGIFLACNRSGFVATQADRDQSERTGPYRLGYSCTAYIHATEHDDGHVTAELCGDHYGHDARMRLPNIIKYIIAHKQLDGEQPMEIIGYLRTHFMEFSHENIYAQRICFVDMEELKAIYLSSTKKWEQNGIPQKLEIWEEELLDRAGIVREGVPRLREYDEKTTAEIAHEENWPRPRVFVAKIRADDGTLVAADETREPQNNQQQMMKTEFNQYADQPRYEEEVDSTRYMEDYQEESYVADEQIVQSGEEPQNYLLKTAKSGDFEHQLLDDEDVEVQVETEVETSSVTAEVKQCVAEDIGLQSPGQEVVIVDEDVQNDSKMGIEHVAGPSSSHPRVHARINIEEDPDGRFYDGPNSLAVQAVIEEVESFKMTVLKRADNMTPSNLRSLLIRFQSLHNSILDRPGDNCSVPVFPNRGRMSYRPGKGLERPDNQFHHLRGDVTLLPIEDEMSDDECLVVESREEINFNSNIWS